MIVCGRNDQWEEQELPFDPTDLSKSVEYKILRGYFWTFKNPEKLRAVLAVESRAGWELVEKLDDSRIRLRWSITWRQKDGDLDFDPYRSVVTYTPMLDWIERGSFWAMIVLILAVLGFVALCMKFRSGEPSIDPASFRLKLSPPPSPSSPPH